MKPHYLSRFTFPKLYPITSEQTIPLTSETLSDWITTLPMLDNKLLASTISDYVTEINTLVLKGDDRLELLELLRPVVERIMAEMVRESRGRYVEITTENSARQHNAGTILRNMAIGYQRLLVDAATPSWFGASKKDKTLLVGRVLFYASEQLRLAYMLCAFEDKAAWEALNISYHYAVVEQIDKNPLKDPLAYRNGKGSLDLIYKRIILLAMVLPYSLRGAEVDQIYTGLSEVVSALEIAAITEPTDDVMHMVNLKQSSPPSLQTTLVSKGSYYRIGNGDLHQKLSRYLSTGERPEAAQEKGLSDRILKHLCHHLEPIKRRTQSRVTRGSNRINAVIGLEHIHNFLGQMTVIEVAEEVLVQEEIKKEGLVFSRHDLPPKQIAVEKVIAMPIEVPTYQFELENESEKGAQLSCRDLRGEGLYLGCFILLESMVSDIWMLANIRWIRLKNEQEAIFGVELLSSEVEVVEIRLPEKETKAKASILPKILLLKTPAQADTLLLAKIQHQKGQRLILYRQGNEESIVLEEQTWESGGSVQFSYSIQPPEPDLEADNEIEVDLRDQGVKSGMILGS